jgi:hypothetical protein
MCEDESMKSEVSRLRAQVKRLKAGRASVLKARHDFEHACFLAEQYEIGMKEREAKRKKEVLRLRRVINDLAKCQSVKEGRELRKVAREWKRYAERVAAERDEIRKDFEMMKHDRDMLKLKGVEQ